MPKQLTAEQVDLYHQQGYTTATTVLTAGEARGFRREIERYEAQVGHPLDFPEKSKSYLLFDWADQLVHHPKVLDAVEDLIGPDIMVYHSTMWIKEPRTPAYVLWHQDSTYFFLDPAEHVTAWVALSDASLEAGCMRMLPGSHRLGQLAHVDAPSRDNMIRRGQGVPGYENQAGVAVPLAAGQLSLHHTYTLHASSGNTTGDRRMGYGISYVPTRVRPIGNGKPSALLVRGADRYGHFVPEARLDSELSETARNAHREACARFVALQNAGFTPS